MVFCLYPINLSPDTTPIMTYTIKGGKISPIRWASPVHSELGSGWTIKLLVRKKSSQIWPDSIWSGPTHLNFFCLQKAIGPDQPGF